MSNNIKDPGQTKVILKALAAIVAGFILLYFLIGFIGLMAVGFDTPDKTDLVSWCEDIYVSRRYDELRDYLILYDLYGEECALYWAAVEGYELRCGYIQWSMAAEQGIDGAEEAAADCREQLQAMAENPQFSRNARLLQGFWEDVQSN